jgi:YbbR domain-containing protein
MIRWLGNNIGTLFLAVVLALAAWAAAVNTEDPIEERPFPTPIPIEYAGLSDDLLITNEHPQSALVTLRAPASVWSNISAADIRLIADLTGLGQGGYRVVLRSEVALSPAIVTESIPESVTVKLEPLSTKSVPVQILTSGEPALGFRSEDALVTPSVISVGGPEDSVERVVAARGEIALAGRRETFEQIVTLTPVDEEGKEVELATLDIETAQVEVPIYEAEQYRPVSVIAEITGQDDLQATGYYRVSGIAVSPGIVVVFSSDQEALDALPGFVKTAPLDISKATADIERRLPLDLPEGISPVGDQTVTVVIRIEPIETSITVLRPVNVQGLGPGLYGYPAPEEVSLIISGPRHILENLEDDDVSVVVDVRGLNVGTYQIEPTVTILPPEVEYENLNPTVLEVTISRTPPPTPTVTSPG